MDGAHRIILFNLKDLEGEGKRARPMWVIVISSLTPYSECSDKLLKSDVM